MAREWLLTLFICVTTAPGVRSGLSALARQERERLPDCLAGFHRGRKRDRSLVFVRWRVLPLLTLVLLLFTRQSQREVCTCDVNSSIDHAVKQLIARHVHRLFVIDDQRRLLGVVSIRDLLKTLLNPFET